MFQVAGGIILAFVILWVGIKALRLAIEVWYELVDRWRNEPPDPGPK
jgi:hypothetical protein